MKTEQEIRKALGEAYIEGWRDAIEWIVDGYRRASSNDRLVNAQGLLLRELAETIEAQSKPIIEKLHADLNEYSPSSPSAIATVSGRDADERVQKLSSEVSSSLSFGISPKGGVD